MPKIGRDCWTKYSCGIHGGARKRTSKQDVEGDGRSNGKTRQTAPALIHCRAVDHEYKKESQNSFDQNSLCGREINGELRSASNHDIASEQTEANEGGGDSAKQLRDPIAECRRPRHMAAADQAEGHGRIQLATGNMQGSRNKGGDGETVSKGDGDDVVPGGFDRADPDEDQRERSNEFSEQRAKFSHEVMQSDRFRVDNSVWISARRTGTRLQGRERRCRSNLWRNSDIVRAVAGTADLPHRLCQHVDMPMRLYPMREE